MLLRQLSVCSAAYLQSFKLKITRWEAFCKRVRASAVTHARMGANALKGWKQMQQLQSSSYQEGSSCSDPFALCL